MAYRSFIGAKSRKFKNWARGKGSPPIQVKFHGESNGDSLDALKRRLDRQMAHEDLIGAKN